MPGHFIGEERDQQLSGSRTLRSPAETGNEDLKPKAKQDHPKEEATRAIAGTRP